VTEAPAILTNELRKSYGSLRALRGVDLEVRRGEIFGFLGPNGAGKTTTIRCLLDLIRPNGGSIQVLGLDPQKDPVAVRKRTGYLPGELHFEDNLTVERALRYLDQLRQGKAEWDYVRKLAQRINLDLKPQIKNLSKGNKQKLGVLQALMYQPELLLLDEPTIGLDPLVQHEVLRMISEARDQGTTVFFSSHIMSEVQEIADRVAIIRKGIVVEVAETQALIHRAMRRVEIRFRQPVDASSLAIIPGVKLLDPVGGATLRLQVEGEMDDLVKALAAFPISDLEIERPSLEEVFLAYYESHEGQGG
jgi:ABC-2 type transport system ATP-binding protein